MFKNLVTVSVVQVDLGALVNEKSWVYSNGYAPEKHMEEMYRSELL